MRLQSIGVAVAITAASMIAFASSAASGAANAVTGHSCTITGTAKADVIRGTAKADVICGLGGNDTIYGLGGNDIIDGGPGNDKLYGGSGNDQLFGGSGKDLMDGGSGSNRCVINPAETRGKTCSYVSALPKLKPVTSPPSSPAPSSSPSPTPSASATPEPTPTGSPAPAPGPAIPAPLPLPEPAPTATSPSQSNQTPAATGITVDFEAATNAQLTAFSGDVASIDSHPANGAAGSTKALKVIRGDQPYSGTVFYLATAGTSLVSGSTKSVTALIYSAAAGKPVLLKLEDASDATKSIETMATTSAAGWQTLTFDFNNLRAGTPSFNSSYVYRKAVIFFDFAATTGGAVYHLDQVLFSGASIVTPPAAPTFTVGSLLWSDDFNGSGSIDSTKWTARVCGHSAANGGGTCHNNEQQIYRPEAISLNGSGSAVIATERLSTPQSSGCLAWNGQCSYTSGRFDTQGKVSFQYGVIETRVKNPLGGANWPAFWLLGTNITSVGWPASGEIDVMEGKSRILVSGAIHWSNGGNDAYDYANHAGSDFTNDYHLYQLYWLENYIALYVDGVRILEETPQSLSQPGAWAFNHPFFVILNNAVAPDGGFSGVYDGWTSSQMSIDYVRHYQLNGVGQVFNN